MIHRYFTKFSVDSITLLKPTHHNTHQNRGSIQPSHYEQMMPAPHPQCNLLRYPGLWVPSTYNQISAPALIFNYYITSRDDSFTQWPRDVSHSGHGDSCSRHLIITQWSRYYLGVIYNTYTNHIY
jgi:hypothetical protein